MTTTVLQFLSLALLLLPSNSHSQDAQILLQTKRHHNDDPSGAMNDWTLSSNHHHCNWSGIDCDPRTLAVTSVDLTGFAISGRFPSTFCRIPTLQNLSLAFNYLNGTISSQEISLCSHLHRLNLSENYFVGDLPEFEPEFSNLLSLDLSQNNFSGSIPPSFGRFPKLQVLSLFYNSLNGTIPSFLTNLTELVRFELAMNPFAPGPLPSAIGNLSKLENLWLPSSNLVGTIPDSIGRLAALKNLDLSNNYITGCVPDSIGGLKSVEQIELYENNISGELPEGLGNLTNLRLFDASQNDLTGKLPENFAGLELISLALNDNRLEGEVPAALASNPSLAQLKLFNNSFSGALPVNLGRHSDLVDFDVSSNLFEGEFPPFLCYRGKLIRLVAFNNRFRGNLSDYYGHCENLEYVRIFNNELSGVVPEGIWSLNGIFYLELTNNRFEGSVPSTISGAKNLEKLLIARNHFSGEMPVEICRLKELTVIDTGSNQFSGKLPSCVTEMKQLQKLNLQENMLSGEIPTKLSSNWTHLTTLNLSRNRISGAIPSELGSLPVLNYLDLSHNLLYGEIPNELTNLKLNLFNLSNNNLAGQIPRGFDNNLYLPSLIGNPNLCSPNLKPFPQCPKPNPITTWIPLAFLLTLASLLPIILSAFWFFKSRVPNNVVQPPWKMVSFHRLGFNEDEILASLTESNLIGTGGSGKVYRAALKSGQTVAVKRLWGGDQNPETEAVFRSEVETLGRIRHGNIVKLYFSFASEGFRVLGYEYMETGTLEEVLHGEKGGVLLDWGQRIDIAVGAAQGLAYLHHDCVPPIIHRDVKSNNILLDEEFSPRVADFGLAKTLVPDKGGAPAEAAMSRIALGYF